MRPFVVVAVALAASSCPAPPPPPEIGFRTGTFPAGFDWGTATAGWQIEGDEGVNGPVPSNWSTWMALGNGRGQQTNPNGNGFFTQYAGDAERAASLGLQSFRLSIDWSRIEPAPDVIDEAELAHVADVIAALRANGLRPVVTLWHWTVPLWVQDPDAGVDRIASKDPSVADDFADFTRVIVERFGDDIDMYTVLNEPLSMVTAGYVQGSFPPGRALAIEAATDFGINLVRMHARAYDVIKELDPTAFVGTTMTAGIIYPENPASDQEVFAAESLNYVFNDWVLRALTAGELDVNLDGVVDAAAGTDPPEGTFPELAQRLDFIGVQYYGPVKVKRVDFLDDFAPLYGLPVIDVGEYTSAEDQQLPRNGMGREILARGFADTLARYRQWGLPLVVTENGTTTNRRPGSDDPAVAPFFDEEQAAMYLVTHLWEVARAIHNGADVRGYYHWTLADNYEWVEGRLQRFGAFTVDFDDPALPRTLNAMGQALADVVAAGAVTEDIWNRYVLERFPTDATEAGVGVTTSEPVIGPLP